MYLVAFWSRRPSLPRCLTGSYRYETPRWVGPGGLSLAGAEGRSHRCHWLSAHLLASCRGGLGTEIQAPVRSTSTSTSTSGQRHFSPTPTCIINQPSLLLRRPADDTTRAASTAVCASSVRPSCLHSYSARFCHLQHNNQSSKLPPPSIYYLRRGSILGPATALRIHYLC